MLRGWSSEGGPPPSRQLKAWTDGVEALAIVAMCTILLVSSSVALFLFLQESLDEVGVTNWERERSLCRGILAGGWEPTYDETSVVPAFSHRVRASFVSGGLPSVVHAVHLSSFSSIPALVSAS